MILYIIIGLICVFVTDDVNIDGHQTSKFERFLFGPIAVLIGMTISLGVITLLGTLILVLILTAVMETIFGR
ncbi:MAG: hypothetical protein OEX81_00890 [Candidatus Pacebacteria bacterium]|nr:hypothetical protein [Candidatus Paceibacterota bacterium]